MSRHIYQPMLAQDAPDTFSDSDWFFEIKWDGFRAIAYVDTSFSLKSRNGKELKQNFPELHQLTHLTRNVVLDGEIIVLQNGKPDFQSLLERSQVVSPLQIQRAAKQTPALYIVFDILEKNGTPLTKLPLTERKVILRNVLKESSHVLLNDYVETSGEAYFTLAVQKGLEGVIAKRKGSSYEEGLRTGSWRKFKKLRNCDCVIFGYTLGENVRAKTFGALVLGLYDEHKKPVFVGKVGTGFTQQTLRLLMDKFEKTATTTAPFRVEPNDVVTWLEPKLVCEVAYQAITKAVKLRMARFKRLRGDKSVEQCTLTQLTRFPPQDTTNTRAPKLHPDSDEKLEYASKRNFQVTPEPPGSPEKKVPLIYVIHEHHARHLHWDLRLEKGGVLKSWAIPKGIPEAPKIRRLAVETEDHPYEYGSFEGTIPEEQYGAGQVIIWDKGHYEPKIWAQDKIEIKLDGQRLHGHYILVRLKKSDQKNWLILKGKDDT